MFEQMAEIIVARHSDFVVVVVVVVVVVGFVVEISTAI